tara:strand:+ start:823 stop:1164 length:342 start_codon:yes stop_codon:yes gene_type:complete
MKEKKYRFYSILEDTYLNHLIRIDTDRSLAKNLMRECFSETNVNDERLLLLCDYFSGLYNLEKILNDAERSYIPEEKKYFISQKLAYKMLMYLEFLESTKRELSKTNLSIEIH